MKEVKSCYIHIPFCSNICSYCDFCKFFYQDTLVEEYLDILLQEIYDRYQGDSLETIYIGGGTPSVLTIKQLEKLLTGLTYFKTSKDLEFTIECNVSDLIEEKLILFQKYGINRLSIGVQSFHSEILSFLERDYDKDLILEKVSLAKKYFSNINIDLIYAVPGETLKMLKQDLAFFLSLEVPHISTYSLMIEEHTKLAIRKVEPISDELDSKMYQMIHDTLTEHGFKHYEISNFCLEGYESKHNLTYWKNKQYYGFGLGASGYIDTIRYTNTKNLSKYLRKEYIYETEEINSSVSATYHAILGLRTIYGVSKKEFQELYGIDFIQYFQVSNLLKESILIETEDSYSINPKYWYLLNEILVKFI